MLSKEFVDAIHFLRSVGFFGSVSGTTKEEIAQTIFDNMAEEKRSYTSSWYTKERIEEQINNIDKINPSYFYDELFLLLNDKRLWWGDTKWDVFNGNTRYIELLEKWSRISNGVFSPEQVKEIWDGPEGPITVEFIHDGKSHTISPEYLKGYLDTEISKNINMIIEPSGYMMQEIFTGDQCASFIFIQKDVKQTLLDRGWKIIDDEHTGEYYDSGGNM